MKQWLHTFVWYNAHIYFIVAYNVKLTITTGCNCSDLATTITESDVLAINKSPDRPGHGADDSYTAVYRYSMHPSANF